MIETWMMKLRGMTHGGLNCHEVGEILQQHLDGHIDAARSGRIEIHLEECRRCGLEAETYERIKATLAAQRPEIPAESVARLRAVGRPARSWWRTERTLTWNRDRSGRVS